MIARLRPHFDRIEVIAYVRAPGPFLTALLQERLRWNPAPRDWGRLWPAWPRRFAPWEELADSILYRPYAPAVFPEGDVVQDFCRQLGIAPRRGGRVNLSDGLYQVALHYVQRRFGAELLGSAENIAAFSALRKQTARLPHVPFRIAPAQLRAMLDQHAADCAWIHERLPELDLTEGLEAAAGMAEIAVPDDLCRVAAGLEEQLRALCPLPLACAVSHRPCGPYRLDADGNRKGAPGLGAWLRRSGIGR